MEENINASEAQGVIWVSKYYCFDICSTNEVALYDKYKFVMGQFAWFH